jgi:hypothetical protein
MRFNFFKKKQPDVLNYEGTPAYKLSPAMELYSAVVTASLSDGFYEKADERLNRIRSLIAKCDAAFVARLAVYAREQMHLRSIPLVLAVELAKHHSGDSLVSRMVARTVQRADEITELLAYYALANKRNEEKKLNKLSKQVQKGLSAAFNKFDEYQFAKYNRDAAVTLRDALFLVHPVAKDEAQQVLFNKIVNDELKTPYTWETELSALGTQRFATDAEREAAMRAKWEELIDSGKLGYMALLRNLRNILLAEVSGAHIKTVCEQLTNADAVLRSKQLPFRFLAAHRELKLVNSGYTGMLLDAIEEALKISVMNVRGFGMDTRVVVACDVSGSMQKSVSPRSKVLLFDIGLLLGMVLQYKSANVLCGMFGDTWKLINVGKKNILGNVDEFYKREGEVGYATNGYLVLRGLINAGKKVDKVMMFTDCQMWNAQMPGAHAPYSAMRAMWAEYKRVAPGAKLYLFDLAGNGTVPLQLEGNDVYLIAGWSDKVFDVLDALEKGESSLAKIEEIEL